jgi:pyrimidine-specific ribonucleoside hydrolase
MSALAVALLVFSGSVYAEKVIYDTDFGIDDWSALLLLSMHKDIELLAVTANGAGETHCEPAMRNIPALLDLSVTGDVPFACGDDFPTDGYFAFPAAWRLQADTLSGVSVDASSRPVSPLHSVELIHKVLSEAGEPVVIVTVGSLTNIAQLLEKYPEDKESIKRLVVMGGGFEGPGNIIVPGFTDDHPNKKAEWNIYVDAPAAARVFEAGLPVEVVGLDVTHQVQVTSAFAQAFKAQAITPAAKFWDKVLDDNDWFIDSGEYYFWDVLAALVTIDATFCEGPMAPVWVEYTQVESPSRWTDSAMPSVTTKSQPRKHLDPATAGVMHVGGANPPVKICRTTDARRALALFTTTLNGR